MSDDARCRFAIRDGRDDDGTERWRITYSPATILPETNSTNADPPRGGRLTCDAGVFDASNLNIPVDAIVSVAMFGDDFYDDDTVANHRSFRVRLACPIEPRDRTASAPRRTSVTTAAHPPTTARACATRAASGRGATRAPRVVRDLRRRRGRNRSRRIRGSRGTALVVRPSGRVPRGRWDRGRAGCADARAVGGVGAHRGVVRHHRVGDGVVPHGDAGAAGNAGVFSGGESGGGRGGGRAEPPRFFR